MLSHGKEVAIVAAATAAAATTAAAVAAGGASARGGTVLLDRLHATVPSVEAIAGWGMV